MPDEDSNDSVSESEESGLYRKYREPDRKRGIFTKKDRQYLLGELEIDGQDERNLRYRMRQRVLEAVHDLILLESEYPDEELKKVFENSVLGNIPPMAKITTLAYRIARFTYDNPVLYFEAALRGAIREEHRDDIYENGELRTKGVHLDLELSIEPYEYTFKEIVQKHIRDQASTEAWDALNNYVGDHYLPKIPEDELEGKGTVDMRPPGSEEVLSLHPILAEKIAEVQKG